jgi:acyl-CoA reductase-like NAD-dependent aldehyde dehydrogenase
MLTWDKGDDPQGYIVQAVDSGRLEAALTALGLKEYADLAELPEEKRAELLRNTAALAAELTRRIRHLTVAHRHHGASWAELASLLVDNPDARSTDRSTYQAGLRQMGRTVTED